MDGFSLFVECINNMLSNNEEERAKSTNYIIGIFSKLNDNFQELLNYTTEIILSDKFETTHVLHSFILLHKIFSPGNGRTKSFLVTKWNYSLSLDERNRVFQAAVRGLYFSDIRIRKTAACCLALIYCLDRSEIDIVDILLVPMLNNQYDFYCTMGSLYAIDELVNLKLINSENVKQETLNKAIKTISQLFCDIMSEPTKIKMNEFIDFINIFANSFYIFGTLFEISENRRPFILLIHQVFGKTCPEVHFCLYHLIYSFFISCYDTILPEMEYIYEIIINSLGSPNVKYAVSCHEFILKICNFEKEKYNLANKNMNIIYNGIVVKLAQTLVPYMVNVIKVNQNQENDDDDNLNNDENNLQFTAIECLKNIAYFYTKEILNYIGDYFEKNIYSDDWKARNTSLISISVLIKGREFADIHNFFSTHFDTILNMVGDKSINVQVSALWLIQKIVKEFNTIIKNKENKEKISIIINSFKNSTSHAIIEKICNIINSYSILCKQNPDLIDDNFFKTCYETILYIFNRDDAIKFNLLPPSTNAYIELVQITPVTFEKEVISFLDEINNKIYQLYNKLEGLESSDACQRIAFLFDLIFAISKKFGSNIKVYAKDTIQSILHCLLIKNVTINEEAQLALSSLIIAIGNDIYPYAETIFKLMIYSQQSQCPSIIRMSAIVFENLFTVLKGQLPIEQCMIVVKLFGENLHSNILKPADQLYILDAIGEMIRSLGISGLCFCDNYMNELNQIQNYEIQFTTKYDKMIANKLVQTLIHGYKSVLFMMLDNDISVEDVVKKFNQIYNGFVKINKIRGNISEDVLSEIISFLKAVVGDNRICHRVNHKLNSKAILDILDFCIAFRSEELNFKARATKKCILIC